MPPATGKVEALLASPASAFDNWLKLYTHQSSCRRRVATRAAGTAASDSGGRRGKASRAGVASNTTPAARNAFASRSMFASGALSLA